MQIAFSAPRSAHLLGWIMPDEDGILGDGPETEAPELGDLGDLGGSKYITKPGIEIS